MAEEGPAFLRSPESFANLYLDELFEHAEVYVPWGRPNDRVAAVVDVANIEQLNARNPQKVFSLGIFIFQSFVFFVALRRCLTCFLRFSLHSIFRRSDADVPELICRLRGGTFVEKLEVRGW